MYIFFYWGSLIPLYWWNPTNTLLIKNKCNKIFIDIIDQQSLAPIKYKIKNKKEMPPLLSEIDLTKETVWVKIGWIGMSCQQVEIQPVSELFFKAGHQVTQPTPDAGQPDPSWVTQMHRGFTHLTQTNPIQIAHVWAKPNPFQVLIKVIVEFSCRSQKTIRTKILNRHIV